MKICLDAGHSRHPDDNQNFGVYGKYHEGDSNLLRAYALRDELIKRGIE